MLSRNRIWDCEYDIYSHLQEKNRVLKCGTKKFDYFNTLLKCFVVEDHKKADLELVQFMDGLHSVVKSQMLHHLEQPNTENTAEEKGTDNGVIVDPQHKYFMDHVRPHGKSYVLEIPEDGVCVKYEPHPSSPESEATYTNDYDKVNVCLDIVMHVSSLAKSKNPNVISSLVKRRGRKPKVAKVSAAMDGNVKRSDVTSETQKHVSKRKGKQRTEMMKKQCISEILVIKDSEDAAGEIVEHCWQEYHKGKTTTVFEEKLMEELKAPFCEEEYKRLLHIITVRKPVQRHRDLRGGIIIYDEPRLGKSYLDCNVDLAKRIKAAHGDHPRVLNLMRGFFYWLKNLSHDGAFMPWKYSSWLDVLPQQLEG
ncbi:uncharacterized protein LOC106754724 [Vigna radiata var. radiata]|uniref:Uncharacterized protein LOC106754724 n=1 Tax=Vigna radiata var. radiata TaxID=3916 RepID=A0A1S3TET1_VIGRR|nr:uncharacterized protein LOC106754724 [Vigna radiata var. radiata]